MADGGLGCYGVAAHGRRHHNPIVLTLPTRDPYNTTRAAFDRASDWATIAALQLRKQAMSAYYIFVIVGLISVVVGFQTNMWGMLILNLLFLVTLAIIWPVLSLTNNAADTATKFVAFVGIAACMCVPMTLAYFAQQLMRKQE